MKKIRSVVRVLACAVGALCVAKSARAEALVTQTFNLNPGWNAIYVEALPDDARLTSIFTSTNIASVWTYENRLTSADFIQNVTEQTLAKAGWFSWVPTNRVESFQNDVFTLQVNHAYLVKNAGTNQEAVTVTGRPSLRAPQWKSDAYNLLGFPIDAGAPPTFLNFFKPSPAHYSTTGGLQAIYRMNASGVWELVAPSDQMASGAAYWVFCKGSSDYMAPLTVSPAFGDGLDFGTIASEESVTLKNLSSSSLNINITDVNAPGDNPLSYAERAPDQTTTWPAYVSPLTRVLSGGASKQERIGVRRADMISDTYSTVLQIFDNAGTRINVPVSAKREASTAIVAAAKLKKGQSLRSAATAGSHAGLWVGTVTLNGVSEAHSGTLVTNIAEGYTLQLETNIVTHIVTSNQVPNNVYRTNVSMATTPTGSEFRMRLLVHVDDSGQTRLLKEVIQMWQPGTTTNDANGRVFPDQPGHVVLVTDDSKISQLAGITSKGGAQVGRRLSTAAFDFPNNELPMGGDFVEGGTVAVTNSMSGDFATNPFKHKYHPDHKAGFDIKRVIQLQVSSPPTNAVPGYGERVLEGTYQETVTGLHRTNIVVSGVFNLNRISTASTLNQ